MSPACPACDERLYGWVELEDDPGEPVLLERCENCGFGATAGTTFDAARAALLDAAREAGSGLEVRVPNRRSFQAGLGGRHWAALHDRSGPLYLTPESARRLAARAGLEVTTLRYARWGRCQLWMWQTIVNAFTFRDNLALEARAGRLRSRAPRGRIVLAIDTLVTVFVAPVAALIALPLELAGALSDRGGELVVRLER